VASAAVNLSQAFIQTRELVSRMLKSLKFLRPGLNRLGALLSALLLPSMLKDTD